MTPLGQAITDAGWPPEAIAKSCRITTTEVRMFLEKGPNFLDARALASVNAWVAQHVGQANDGKRYVDPYRPVMVMHAIDHPVVPANWRGTGGNRV